MNKLYVTITIDTENPQIPFTNGTWKTDTMIHYYHGKNHGIRYILKLFKKYQIYATWYLNVYEKYLFGERLMSDVCSLLMDFEQDIELHTHPVWLMDADKRKRTNMYQYSLEEQIYILKKGIDDIYRYTGIRPIAHRGGAYGVNKDTFTALKECNISVDSSVFYGNENCKIKGSAKNRIYELYDIVEFPVSIYKRQTCSVIPYKKQDKGIQKVDINYSTAEEIIGVCKNYLDNGGGYMNLFMHSFSFYKFFGMGIKSLSDVTERNMDTVNKFHKVIKYINRNPNIELITVRELYEKTQKNNAFVKNCIPTVSVSKFFGD